MPRPCTEPVSAQLGPTGAQASCCDTTSNHPVPPAELRAAVERALTDPSRRASAKALADTVGEGGGAPAGVQAIKDLLSAAG